MQVLDITALLVTDLKRGR